MFNNLLICLVQKGKVHTRTGQEGSKEEYMFSSTLSFTPAIDGVDINAMPLALYHRDRRLGGPKGCSGRVRKISHSPGFDRWTVQPIAIRY